MDKSIQAINGTTIAPGSKGSTGNKGSSGEEAVPFSEVFSPAQARVSGEQKAANEGGNELPEEAALPPDQLGQALTEDDGEATEREALTVVTDETLLLSSAANASVITRTATLPGEQPVATVSTDAAKTLPAALQQNLSVADRQAVAAPQVDAETAELNRVIAGKQQNPGQTVAAVPLQSPDLNSTLSSADGPVAVVRAGVQQALAAQVGQQGLQQSLQGGGGKSAAVLDALTHVQSQGVASFTSALADVESVTSPVRIPVPVGEQGWGRAVGEQVVWHVSQNIKSASLRLNPQHLGPLEMQVHMEGDKATLAFTSQHAVVRDSLESALPRLREMFAASGLDIVDVNVSQRDTREQPNHDRRLQANSDDAEQQLMSGEQSLVNSSRIATAIGLVDYYV